MVLRVRNTDGVFEFVAKEKRWLCIAVTAVGRRQFMANGFVFMAHGTVLNKQARAEGAVDSDFGIVAPKAAKVKRPRTAGTRGPRKAKSRLPDGFVALDLS